VPFFPEKNWPFETLIPLGISINLPWGGYGYFLELHNVVLTRDRLKKIEEKKPLIFEIET